MSVRGQVGGRQRRTGCDAPLGVHGDLGIRARRDAVFASDRTPAATASPPTASIWTMPLLPVVASGYENAPNVWPTAKSMIASMATWFAAFRLIPRSPELSALRHLNAPSLGRRTRPVAALAPAPNSAPSTKVFRPVIVTAPSLRT